MKISTQELFHFFNNVMLQLGYYEWSLNLVPHSSEGFCWKKFKRIDVGMDNRNIKRLLLHEIAHLDTCRFVNNKHHISFWERYEDLMQRFLPGVDFETRYNENVGYFRVCYENTTYS